MKKISFMNAFPWLAFFFVNIAAHSDVAFYQHLAFDLRGVIRICVLSDFFLWGDVLSIVYVGCWAVNHVGSRGCKILMWCSHDLELWQEGYLSLKSAASQWIPENLQAVLHTLFNYCKI